MPRPVKVYQIWSSGERVYVRVVLDGVPHEASVLKADLDALTTRAQKLQLLLAALLDAEATRGRGAYSDLLGDTQVP
jgi:hypothetical protein